jgi:hypothetical protein
VSVSASGVVQSLGTLSVIASTVSSTTLTHYYNGVPATGAARPAGSLANATPLRVGSAGSAYFDGEGFAFLVFRRALSATEITVLSDWLRGRA